MGRSLDAKRLFFISVALHSFDKLVLRGGAAKKLREKIGDCASAPWCLGVVLACLGEQVLCTASAWPLRPVLVLILFVVGRQVSSVVVRQASSVG